MNWNSHARRNFRYLALVLAGGITIFGEKHGDVFINKSYASDYNMGKKRLNDVQRKKLEEYYQLPSGWFDRDNDSLVRLGNEDFNFLQMYLNASQEQKVLISSTLTMFKDQTRP